MDINNKVTELKYNINNKVNEKLKRESKLIKIKSEIFHLFSLFRHYVLKKDYFIL